MNADWLYDEYFGEYGFPDEFKASFIDEIKLVANGFALQFARGEDVEASINLLRRDLFLAQISGQFGAMISQMSETWYSGDYEAMNARPPEVDLEPLPDSERFGTTSPEEIARLKALEVSIAEDDAAILKAQEELVEKYNLPYDLPGRAPKYIIYSASMKGSGGWKGDDNNKDKEPEYKHELNVSGWSWRPGDIIWSDGGAGLGHMGIVTQFNNTEGEIARGHLPSSWSRPDGALLSIIDANTGGVGLHEGGADMNVWQARYDTVRRYTYAHFVGWPDYLPPCDYKDCSQKGKNYFTYAPRRMRAIVNWAMRRVGRLSYSVLASKNADNDTYCSLFVWGGYWHTAQSSPRPEWREIDLDSFGGWVVFPNDILNHPLVVNMAESKKKKVAPCQYFCF